MCVVLLWLWDSVVLFRGWWWCGGVVFNRRLGRRGSIVAEAGRCWFWRKNNILGLWTVGVSNVLALTSWAVLNDLDRWEVVFDTSAVAIRIHGCKGSGIVDKLA
ncbi:MAG: hypothetical protein ACRC5V_00015 [Aeromonas sp.]